MERRLPKWFRVWVLVQEKTGVKIVPPEWATREGDFWKTLYALPHSDIFILCSFTDLKHCYLCLQSSCRTTSQIQVWEQPGNLCSAKLKKPGGIWSSDNPTLQNQAASLPIKIMRSWNFLHPEAGLWLFSTLPTLHSWQIIWKLKCLLSVQWSDVFTT